MSNFFLALIIFLLLLYILHLFDSKADVEIKARQLEAKLNGEEFNRLLDEFHKELNKQRKEAKNEADLIRKKARDYADTVKTRLYNEREQFQSEKERLIERNQFLEGLYNSFQDSYISGRKWLAEQYVELLETIDSTYIEYLLIKKNPAIKAADKLSKVQQERRELVKKYKLLEYQLKTYEEYFPFILDYRNEILNDEITGLAEVHKSEIDPVNRFLSPDEYSKLSTTDKNQLALERYIQGNLSRSEIGKMYERYLGHFYEKQGYNIEYVGIEKGFEDLGQDLICTKGNQVIVIQAKCWGATKEIRERHILQLFSTTLLHKMENANKNAKYTSILYTSTKLSNIARDVADKLKVKYVEYFTLEKTYPMIKCNVGKGGEKIYHLPFDQMYDKVKITDKEECYVTTVKEAEEKGFRRAFRYKGIPNN